MNADRKIITPIDKRFVLLDDSTRYTNCNDCPLLVERNTGGVVPPELIEGETRKVFLIGEAPGRQERKRHRPFIGPAGQVLRTAMERTEAMLGLGISWVVCNVIQCFPRTQDNPDRFRVPSLSEATCCRGNLEHLVSSYSPAGVILLGQVPQFYIHKLGILPKDKTTRTFAMYHPSYILRRGGINTAIGRQWLSDFVSNIDSLQQQGLLIP